jgi:hypothetical protein
MYTSNIFDLLYPTFITLDETVDIDDEANGIGLKSDVNTSIR